MPSSSDTVGRVDGEVRDIQNCCWVSNVVLMQMLDFSLLFRSFWAPYSGFLYRLATCSNILFVIVDSYTG